MSLTKPENIHNYIKYMGSKTKILDFVIDGINEVYDGMGVCDLFSGSATLSAALNDQVDIWANDIQHYSSVLSSSYLLDSHPKESEINADDLIAQAHKNYALLRNSLEFDSLIYLPEHGLEEYNKIEKENQKLLTSSFESKWHLFTKYYSGTWWSADQCMWIDSLRCVIQKYKNHPTYNTMLASLMHAMAYTSQGTGHYAQYRDAKNESSLKDIQIYRKKDVLRYFKRKYENALSLTRKTKSKYSHTVTTLDYTSCLSKLKGQTIYADPPYCFVHYSRFYHAIETLTLYDYPEIQSKGGTHVKGRYRENRHQSPFSIKSKVRGAFEELFLGAKQSNANLVLSYSDTGMVELSELLLIAKNSLTQYDIEIKHKEHVHMTMGRSKDRSRNINEILILAKKRQ